MSIGQNRSFDFSNDSEFEYKYHDRLRKSILSNVDFQQIEFQLRFWELNPLSTDEVFVLNLTKNGEWMINRYKALYSGKMDMIVLLEREINESVNLNQMWKNLMRNKVLSLVDYRDLNFQYERNGHVLDYDYQRFDEGISDGIIYMVELITDDKKRKYVYNNPQSFDFAFNHAKVPEIEHMLGIIEVFEELSE